MLRRLLGPAVAAAIVAATFAGGAAGAGASTLRSDADDPAVTTTAPAAAGSSEAASLAVEVCETMVADAVVAATGKPLSAPQAGAWNGSRYTCTFPVGTGKFVIRVDSLGSRRNAIRSYKTATRAVKVSQRLQGLGEKSLLAKDGKVFARKDVFVLVADPSKLPKAFNKTNVTLSAVEAVLSCWVGTGATK